MTVLLIDAEMERVDKGSSSVVDRLSEVLLIADWRMMKAYALIKHSTISTEGVAEQVGFSTARTLSKAFQRKFGCTPSVLRNKGNF